MESCWPITEKTVCVANGCWHYFAEAWGIQAVMILPLLGTFMVFLLLLLIMLEAKLSSLSEITRAGS
jgi:hypothetical protein